ncbi:putative major pilin subunit [Anaerohalosphaera lusitana]|uniref:Putative major pilin subunit n=1 Tax=Anaerohalosphaera lusitana TaxID=1936003 RepID=A0A1U9NK22_9BACT|nr:type II secretion system protein [Anaerohalosphaera lusitana]AQT68088.1 putative major pilin subunit [Anaerohalosphaera lusitana]
MKNKEGFTLIELLVVIAIIALLMSIMMPALSMVKERARRVTCGSNLKQVGISLFTYAQDNDNKVPENYMEIAPRYTGFYAYAAYWINPNATNESHKITDGPVNVAVLFDAGYLKDPEIFYCPSARGVSDLLSYDHYVGDLSWPFVHDPDAYHANFVRISYNYLSQGRGREVIECGSSKRDVRVHILDNQVSNMTSSTSMLADVISSQSGALHRAGVNKPAGINVLHGDGHVLFCNEKEAINNDDFWGVDNHDELPNQNGYNLRGILGLFKGTAQIMD